jgi:hypothetical protein
LLIYLERFRIQVSINTNGSFISKNFGMNCQSLKANCFRWRQISMMSWRARNKFLITTFRGANNMVDRYKKLAEAIGEVGGVPVTSEDVRAEMRRVPYNTNLGSDGLLPVMEMGRLKRNVRHAVAQRLVDEENAKPTKQQTPQPIAKSKPSAWVRAQRQEQLIDEALRTKRTMVPMAKALISYACLVVGCQTISHVAERITIYPNWIEAKKKNRLYIGLCRFAVASIRSRACADSTRSAS